VTTKIRQVAALSYRAADKNIEVLLVTSVRTGSWILPKGILDKGLTLWETAREKAYEEAGVIGEIGQEPIGDYRYRKGSAKIYIKDEK
jgi:8-oxo-dGTP pyrophosphatase MutT (NUDIX family)